MLAAYAGNVSDYQEWADKADFEFAKSRVEHAKNFEVRALVS